MPNDLCKRLLKARSLRPRKGSPWTTDAEFDAITVYVQPPEDEVFLSCDTRARTDLDGSAGGDTATTADDLAALGGPPYPPSIRIA